MHQIQQLSQQLQRTQQLSYSALNICQQVVQELQQIAQIVPQIVHSQQLQSPYQQTQVSPVSPYAPTPYATSSSLIPVTSQYVPSQATGFSGVQSQWKPVPYSLQQPAPYGANPAGLQAVMNADRASEVQENTPSYRNYNTLTPGMVTPQYNTYASPTIGTTGVNYAGLQSVMAADRFAAIEDQPSYRNYNQRTFVPQGPIVAGYGVAAAAQADRMSFAY